MAWNKDHKQNSRKKILDSADSLFAEKGFEKTGIDEVMQNAGMTRGAFYSHFSSKSELYQEAMTFGALRRFRLALETRGDLDSNLNLDCMVQHYLSLAHIQGEGGCPLAFLVTDVAQQNDSIRNTYTRLFKGLSDRMTQASPLDRQQVLAKMVLMVGGVAIARALSDDESRNELLEAVRAELEGIC